MLDPLGPSNPPSLQLNARISTSGLARRLELSRSTVQSRIDRLEEMGVIDGYTLRLGRDFKDRLIRAHVLICVSPKLANQVAQDIEAFAEIQTLHTISGAFDMIAEVATETMEALDHITDRIGTIPGSSALRRSSSCLRAFPAPNVSLPNPS